MHLGQVDTTPTLQNTHTHISITPLSLLLRVLLQIFTPECCGVALWIQRLRLKKNNPSFVNSTSTFPSLLSQHTCTDVLYPLIEGISPSLINRNDSLRPSVYTYRPYRLAHMDLAKSIFKMLSACRLMMELKMSTTSHTPSSPEADKSFFSSLAFGIDFLQQLFNEYSTYASSECVVCMRA